MRAEIISVGTELLLGDIVNTNAQYLSQELATLGFTVYYQHVVGDNSIRLKSLVQLAKERSDVLIITGGLGPTEDDLTKETVAEVFGDTLVMDPDILIELESFFIKRGTEMPPNNRKQALVPRSGRALPNPNGTAPGAMFRQGGTYAFLLPGPPREMKPMFEEQVRPMLEGMQEGAIRSLDLRTIGIGESDLEGRVISLLGNSNPTAALYALTGEVRIRITAKAPTVDQANVMCAEYATLFHKILGDLIYSVDGGNLETTVVNLLASKGETLALAESCTGGLLAERITSVPGSSNVFGFGAVTYANDAKHKQLGVGNGTLQRYGAVSSQVAAEMAFGAAKKGNATYGVGITGVAGPGGGTPQKPVGLVYIAVARENEVVVRKMEWGDRDRDFIRIMATNTALNMVRRLAIGLPVDGSKTYTRTQHADFERESKPRRKGGLIGRALAAVIAVIVIFALIFIGFNYTANRPKPEEPRPGFPASQGLRYGSEEYSAAAREKVRSENAQDPSVVGMIAFPNAVLEEMVTSGSPQAPEAETLSVGSDTTTAESATDPDYAELAEGSQPGAQSQNAYIMGGNSFSTLFSYIDTDGTTQPTTFTYFTGQDSRTYRIIAAYLMDDIVEGEEPEDGFDPAVEDLSRYTDFLTFLLGSRMRSLIDVPISAVEDDSYMTLSAHDPGGSGRRLYVCGRLANAGELDANLEDELATPAGASLLPDSLYEESGAQPPDMSALYAYWFNWYLTGGVTNTELQLRAGMPDFDAVPTQEIVSTEDEQAESKSESSSVAEDSSGSASSSDSASESKASPSSSGASSSDASSSAKTEEEVGDVPITGDILPGQNDEVSTEPPVAPDDTKAATGETLVVTLNGQVVEAPTDVILAQIVQAEGATLEREAQKALAVAAHSWILNQQGAGNLAPEVVGKPASTEVLENVGEIAGLVLSGNGRGPAFTPWCYMGAMGTNVPQNVWGPSRNYLSSVALTVEESRADWRKYSYMTIEDFQKRTEEYLGVDYTLLEDPNTWITDIKRDDAGYVTTLTIGEVEVTGYDFWQNIAVEAGQPLMVSPSFDITLEGESFMFTSLGEGHGCGMSIVSAQGLARDGQGYEAILGYFYPGAQLIRADKAV